MSHRITWPSLLPSLDGPSLANARRPWSLPLHRLLGGADAAHIARQLCEKNGDAALVALLFDAEDRILGNVGLNGGGARENGRRLTEAADFCDAATVVLVCRREFRAPRNTHVPPTEGLREHASATR